MGSWLRQSSETSRIQEEDSNLERQIGMAHTSWDIILNASTIKNVQSVGYNQNASIIAERAAGAHAPGKLYQGNSEPMVTISSTDIAGLVALNTSTFASVGICIISNTTTVPLAKRADCAVTAAGSVHTALSCNNTIVIPTSFEASQDSDTGATCTMEARFRSSDGLTDPVTVTNTASLASSTLGDSFGLGRVWIDDVEITQLVGITVTPNITLQIQRVGGGIYPVAHYLISTEPVVDITSEDLSLLDTFTPNYGSAAAIQAYFRKRKDGAVFFDEDEEEHVRFSSTGALSKADSFEVNRNSNGTITIRAHMKTLTAAAGVVIAAPE
jgi:hypothetical protein